MSTIYQYRQLPYSPVYALPLVQDLLVKMNRCKYIESPVCTTLSVLTLNVPYLLTNQKYYAWQNEDIKIENGKLICDKQVQYGHITSKQEEGIAPAWTQDNHVLDILNYSFYIMDKNPSISHACLQALALLSRIYKEDGAPDTMAPRDKRIKPYVI